MDIPLLDLQLLIATYVLLAVLLAALNFWSNWPVTVKFMSTLVTVAFFFVSYHSWIAQQGWPTRNQLPKQLYIYALHVSEPESIYLWGGDLANGLDNATPRAFALPYSPGLHNQADSVADKLAKGLPIVAQISTPPTQARDQSLFEQLLDPPVDVEFIDAPTSLMPGKH